LPSDDLIGSLVISGSSTSISERFKELLTSGVDELMIQLISVKQPESELNQLTGYQRFHWIFTRYWFVPRITGLLIRYADFCRWMLPQQQMWSYTGTSTTRTWRTFAR
jgi:hypothetical protein